MKNSLGLQGILGDWIYPSAASADTLADFRGVSRSKLAALLPPPDGDLTPEGGYSVSYPGGARVACAGRRRDEILNDDSETTRAAKPSAADVGESCRSARKFSSALPPFARYCKVQECIAHDGNHQA